MLEFTWPWFALLLPLPWLLRRLWPARGGAAGKQALPTPRLLNPGVGHLREAFAVRRVGRFDLSLLERLLAALLWAALVAALMGPQWLTRHEEVVSPGYDLMLAVDASRSMEALDFSVDGRPVNRMAVVKGVVGRFVSQRAGDRIGLVVFGDGAHLLTPLTPDGGAVGRMLDNVQPRMVGDGTAIGDAVGLAVKKLRERPPGSRVIILLTDGENTAGSLSPVDATRVAAHYGIRIYAVGVGSRGKVPFPRPDGTISQEDMQIDEAALERMASATGGAHYLATNTQALEDIYANIDRLEKTETHTHITWLPEPLYRWPLGVALAALLGLGVLSVRRGGALLAT